MRSLFICLLLFSSLVYARMYQWIEPGSGTTQLSGKPPAWYRSTEGGPRIFVFEKGRVIDDTSIEVSDNERELLRQRAFIKAEEDREGAREKLAKANKIKAEFDKKSEEASAQEQPGEAMDEETEISLPDLIEDEETPESKDTPKSKDTGTVLEEMRALIGEWEKEQTRSARNLLEKIDTPSTEASDVNPETSESEETNAQ